MINQLLHLLFVVGFFFVCVFITYYYILALILPTTTTTSLLFFFLNKEWVVGNMVSLQATLRNPASIDRSFLQLSYANI